MIHENLLAVLREHLSQGADDDFVFATPTGAPIDQTNFYNRDWVPMLERLGIRPRDLYARRHTATSAT